MGNIFWLLGPLAVFLFLVVGYGATGTIGPEPGNWVDYLFWSIMALGTLPAFVLLAWLQLRWLSQCLGRYVGRNPHQRHQSAARV